MSEYTPGPWYKEHTHPDPETAKELAYIRAKDTSPFGSIADVYNCGSEDGVQNANARLIAAAPELLEACERVIDSIEGGATTPEESITYVRAAITKAKGENHDE